MAETKNRQRQLDLLITEVATDLMAVPAHESKEAMERTIERLLTFFEVDQTFLRRNDHDAGVSILKAEWPPRDFIPDPDPLGVVPYTADPVFGMIENLSETFISYPEDSREYQERVKAGSGHEQTTLAMVPLLQESHTEGVLGLIRFDDRRWGDDELTTLGAIASLIAQMWGRHDAEAQIAYLAYYDDLTDLPNRRRLVQEIESLKESGSASLLMIDVDNMKVVNDGMSFETGNRFLIGLAERLRSEVRDGSFVARISGDQFAVLVLDTKPEGSEAMAYRLQESLSRPIDIEGVSIARSVSIGVAHTTSDRSGESLITDADVAMFRAKQAGKARVAVFDEDMRAKVLDGFEIEIQLRQAIEAGDQLILYYQPEVDLHSGRVVAVEALLRWNHPDRGILSAGVFIETAEESGLIVEIGDDVLERAIAQLAAWQTRFPDLIMRVNISPAQLMNRDLAAQVKRLLNSYGVSAHRLCLEVTEHVMLSDHQFTLAILDELRRMGVKIALDDFGTGYSSMKQLKRLPIDTIKIDMAFIAGLGVSAHDSAIVDAAILLADAFDLETVAEGIEEERQVLELRDRGCYRAQGFLLSRPDDPKVIEELLDVPVAIAIEP